MRAVDGFSLVELLSVLLIMGLVTTFAFPAWNQMLREQRLQTYIARLNTALLRVKSEALFKGSPVYVCAVNLKSNQDLQGCLADPAVVATHRHWEEGVLFFQDLPNGRNATYDSKEALFILPLAVGAPRLFVSVSRFEISPMGSLKGAPVSFMLKDATGGCQQLMLSAPLRVEALAC